MHSYACHLFKIYYNDFIILYYSFTEKLKNKIPGTEFNQRKSDITKMLRVLLYPQSMYHITHHMAHHMANSMKYHMTCDCCII